MKCSKCNNELTKDDLSRVFLSKHCSECYQNFMDEKEIERRKIFMMANRDLLSNFVIDAKLCSKLNFDDYDKIISALITAQDKIYSILKSK